MSPDIRAGAGMVLPAVAITSGGARVNLDRAAPLSYSQSRRIGISGKSAGGMG